MKLDLVLRLGGRIRHRDWPPFHFAELRTLSDRQTALCRVTPSGGVTPIKIPPCKLDEDEKWFVLDVRSDEQQGR